MKTLQFSIRIHAPAKVVWERMLSPDTYREWTTAFCEGSYYEGSWEEGQKIRFLSPGGEGMTAVIARNKPYELMSIKHLGEVKNGVEDTESESVKSWAPCYETYRFSERDGVTDLIVDMDVSPDFESAMQDMWPKALVRLKDLCGGPR